MMEEIGPEQIYKRQGQCGDHPNCFYRIELLEQWRCAMNKKIDGLQKLLIANLTGICMLLLSSLIGIGVYLVNAH